MANPDTTTEEVDAPDVDFNDVQFQDCPRCTVGVLYVVRWDPDALHEQGENADNLDNPSGGAYEVQCFSCNYRESRAFNAEAANGGDE